MCGNSDPARLSASRGQTPINPPRGTDSTGRARGPPGGHPSRAADPFPAPARWFPGAASGARRAGSAVGAERALEERQQDKENHVRRRRPGQRRHLRVRGGAGRCGRGASSLPPRLQRRRLRVPSFGRLFGFSSAVCRAVWGGLIVFVLVKKSCPSSPEPKRAPAVRRPSRRGRAQVNSMGERQRPDPGSSGPAETSL